MINFDWNFICLGSKVDNKHVRNGHYRFGKIDKWRSTM